MELTIYNLNDPNLTSGPTSLLFSNFIAYYCVFSDFNINFTRPYDPLFTICSSLM